MIHAAIQSYGASATLREVRHNRRSALPPCDSPYPVLQSKGAPLGHHAPVVNLCLGFASTSSKKMAASIAIELLTWAVLPYNSMTMSLEPIPYAMQCTASDCTGCGWNPFARQEVPAEVRPSIMKVNASASVWPADTTQLQTCPIVEPQAAGWLCQTEHA